MTDIYQDGKGQYIVNLGERKSKAVQDRQKLAEYGDIDLASGFKKDLIWTTKDGRKIAIPNLQDSHLLNIIDFLRKRAEGKKRAIALTFLLRGTIQIQHFDLSDAAEEAAYEHLNVEMEKILRMSGDAFLRRIFPIFGKLLEEAYRRKLLISKEPHVVKVADGKLVKPKVKKHKPREMTLIEKMEALRKTCDECGGCEVHKDQWEVAEAIVIKHPGYFLGARRGPNKAWKRLEPPERLRF